MFWLYGLASPFNALSQWRALHTSPQYERDNAITDQTVYTQPVTIQPLVQEVVHTIPQGAPETLLTQARHVAKEFIMSHARNGTEFKSAEAMFYGLTAFALMQYMTKKDPSWLVIAGATGTVAYKMGK